MVIVSLAHDAVTPAGNPVAVPIPVAPVVACTILVKAILIHETIGILLELKLISSITCKFVMPPVLALNTCDHEDLLSDKNDEGN